MIFQQGGHFGGYVLAFKNGRPFFAYNMLALGTTEWEAPAALSAGAHAVDFTFKADGGIGKGGTGTLLVDGCATAMLRTPLRRFRYRGQGVFVSWDLADLDEPVVEDNPRIYRVGPLDDARGRFFSGWLSSRASVVLFKVDDDA